MACVSSSDIDQQMEGETQDTRRVTIVLGDEIHLIAQSLENTDRSWKKRNAQFFRGWSSSKSVLDPAEQARPPLCCWRWFIRCCWSAPCPFSSCARHISRLEALCATLSEKCSFRTLLLIYVFLNEVLRYHSGGGAISAAAAGSEMFLVLLFLLEFVYDSISLGLWRGSVWFFRSRRCVYNLVVLLAAVACGILDIYAKTKPTWYTAQVALVVSLGRFIRLFRVYQSQSFQVVHSIFKKSSFNLIALAGLGFLSAFFYAILFFHSYGYTQFNLCYNEPINGSASSTSIESNVDPVSNSFTVHSWNDARSSNASKTNGLTSTIDAPQNIDNDGFCSSASSEKADLYISRANSSGPAKELVCNANSVYWEFDTNQQYLCTAGRVCQAGTTCRNPFFDRWTSVCSEAERRRLQRAGWDLIFENRVNDWGTTGFHSGISTLTTLLECITLEGWSALMYRQADGDATTRGLLAFVLFLSVVILGNMLLMNLVVAVVWENTILKSTTLETVDAREEDLQLFEILGMKWVRHLVQQLSRHDIFSSEEKMVAYQHARYESQSDKERFGPPCTSSVGSNTPVGTPVAVEPIHDATGSACSTLTSSAASSGQGPSARYSTLPGSSAACLSASAAVACDTTTVATSRGTSPGDPVTVVDVSRLTECSRANPACLTHSSSPLPPSGVAARTLLASPPSVTTAAPCPCAPSVAVSLLSSVFSFIRRVWPQFCSRVRYSISRKRYVALMFCTALVDVCCIIGLTWTNQESVTLVTNCVFTLIYLTDICLQLIGFGWRQFLRDGFKVFDSIVVVVEVAGLFFHFSCCGGALRRCMVNRIYPDDPTLFNTYVFFRGFHAFRIFRLIRNFAALRILVELMCDLLRNIFFIYALVLFEVFAIALMGVIFFRDSHYEERASTVEFPTITLFFNFSNIWKAFMLVYCLMTGESWNVVMSEFFAVYAEHNYSPSEDETLLPSYLLLKTPRPAYIITTYVFITVVFLCCFIFNVFGGILIGQYVISRRSVYNRHVFKLLKVCRELGLEMPSPEAVGSANLQRMYSLVQPKNRGWAARKRALSLFLQAERIQQRFSVACASPTARKIITRMSGSFSRQRLSSVSPSNLAHPQAAVEKPRKAPAANPHCTRKGSRRRRLRHMWRVTASRRVQLQLRSRKARASPCVKKQHEMPSRRTACSTVTDATTLATPQGPLPSEASALPDNKTVWALSTSTKSRSFLFYAVSHEDLEQTYKSPQAEMTMGKRICSSIRAVCCSLAIAFIWILDAVVRRSLFCMLLLERQLISLDIDRPDACLAYVRCILEDEDTVGQQREHEQNSSSSSSSTQQQTRGGVRASTCSSCSHRRVTGELPRFELGGFLHSFLYRLMVSNMYDVFLATVNVVSLLCLIVEACLTRNSTAGFCFACLECIFAGFFLLENVVRMAVFGLLVGATRTNVLNLALSLSSVILLLCNQVWLLSPSLQAAYTRFWATPAFRTVKVLRSIRALQLVDTLHMDGIRIVARSLASSIGELRNLAALLALVTFAVAAFITQMMSCFNTPRDPSNGASASSIEVPPTGRTGKGSTENVAFPRDIIINKFMKTGGAISSNTTDSMRRPISNTYISPASSLAASSGTHGVHNERADRSRAAAYTFDNMVESLLGVFVLSTAEGWPLLLAQLLQQLPEQQHTMLTVLIVVFVTLIAIICVNVFVGIIVEASRRKKTRMEMQGSLLSPAIHKWIEVQKIMFDAPLQHGDTVPDFDRGDHKRLARFRKGAAAIVTSPYYHYFDLSQTFFLCFLLVFHGPWYDVLMGHVTRTTDKIFYSIAVILCGCFVAGVILKVVARGRFFLRDTLDIIDLLICILLVVRVLVILSLRGQWTHLKLHHMSDFWPMSFRLFRVARYLYRHVHFFRTLFTTITGVARAFLTALGLLGIALFFFALWGVFLFHDSPILHYTNKYANFTNLLAAFMAVIGACTGEDWHLMLQQMRLYYEEGGETMLEFLVVIYFVAFILVSFILMSLFTSTVLEKYMETVRNESLWKISREHRRLLDLWTPDENGTLFKTLEETLRILQSIEFPVGLRNAIPPVETAEAAFALLAKFELPLYYCGKAEGNITGDFDNSNAGRDTGASYKVHIRDVVLNAARRACKFHAASNGEGVLEEGRVALDPRVTQSWVAKFPELNRIGCVYDLNHFTAAKTIQMSWRRRHIVVNGHIANPEWCKGYIVTLMRGLVASRTQRPASRTRRGSRNDTRRESFREKEDRSRRSSADSSSYCGTHVASEAESTRGRKCHMTVDRQESWMTSSTLLDGSRRPSFGHRRSKGEMAAPKRQLAVHAVSSPQSPPASSIRERPSTAAIVTSMNGQPVQRKDGDGRAGASRAGQAPPSATQTGRKHASAAPCPAVTPSTCPGQTDVGAQPVHGDVDVFDTLPGRIGQDQRRRTKSARRHASTRPYVADTGVGKVHPTTTHPGRRRVSATPCLAVTPLTSPDQTHTGAQPATREVDGGAVVVKVGQVQSSVANAGCRRASAAPCLVVTSPTRHGQAQTDTESAQTDVNEVGGTGRVHPRVINSGRRRARAAPCPTVTSAGLPLSHRSISDNDCEERKSSETPSQRSSPWEHAHAPVTVEDKRLSLSADKLHSRERGKPEPQGRHKSSQNDTVAGQTTPLSQPVVHRGGFGRGLENEANQVVSHEEKLGFRVDHRGHENNAQRIPQGTSVTRRSVGGSGTCEDYVDDNVLSGTVVRGLIAEAVRVPSSVHYADRPSQNGEGNSAVDLNRKILASPSSKEKPSGNAGFTRCRRGSAGSQ